MKRVRRRYLAVGIDSEASFSSTEFMDAVYGAVLKLYGEYGASQTGLVLISYDVERRFAVIRAAQTAVEMVRAVLATMTKIGNEPTAAHVLAVSGTIKALREKTSR